MAGLSSALSQSSVGFKKSAGSGKPSRLKRLEGVVWGGEVGGGEVGWFFVFCFFFLWFCVVFFVFFFCKCFSKPGKGGDLLCFFGEDEDGEEKVKVKQLAASVDMDPIQSTYQ